MMTLDSLIDCVSTMIVGELLVEPRKARRYSIIKVFIAGGKTEVNCCDAF